jgi:hypothetical protein
LSVFVFLSSAIFLEFALNLGLFPQLEPVPQLERFLAHPHSCEFMSVRHEFPLADETVFGCIDGIRRRLRDEWIGIPPGSGGAVAGGRRSGCVNGLGRRWHAFLAEFFDFGCGDEPLAAFGQFGIGNQS